jgi:uncharacterized protein (TIGR02466 family)
VASVDALFPTKLYRARLARADALNGELMHAARVIAADDKAGQSWCREHGYRGYTSYASLNDLAWRDPTFAALKDELDAHAAAFARELDFDLSGRKLDIDSMWVNILAPGGSHSGHIHPLSVFSGVYYVDVPDGASALKIEDPRLAMMMAAPPQKARVRADNRRFLYLTPASGGLIMWESWLRHEVPVNEARRDRISISFNYALG